MARALNDAGFNLIKSSEGCELTSYPDGGGVWTIGYGHIEGVHEGMEITQYRADEMFRTDLQYFCDGVEKLVEVDLTDNQFGALVSLAFNIGLEAFKKSTLLKLVNVKDFESAGRQFLRWNKDNGFTIPGLTARREREKMLFGS